MRRLSPKSVSLFVLLALSGCAHDLAINQIQFVGSHNSYKMAMSEEHQAALAQLNPTAAQALDYAHVSLEEQLDLGIRKLEIDLFYQPEAAQFAVGHVQVIDMNSHCSPLRMCLSQLRAWSEANPRHVPIWISFNAKDQNIEGLPNPHVFDALAFAQMDAVIEGVLGDKLIRPEDVKDLNWPSLAEARGKFLLILDEQGEKRATYWEGWQSRPMFTNAPADHPAAAVMVINDPVANTDEIRRLVRAGYLVRTRADADTVEARQGNTARREAAFLSGAQAVSTDYYFEDQRFGTGYVVTLPERIRCNPVNTSRRCRIDE